MSRMSTQEAAIFWDYENCPAPAGGSGCQLVKRIRSLVQPFGPIKLFKAYLSIAEQSQLTKNSALRSELQASGVSLTDTPHNSRKDVADKMMIVDMLTHAMDNPAPATIVVISGDRDFAYAMAVLRLRQYDVVLITLSNAHISLTSQASTYYDWALDVLAGANDCEANVPSTPSRKGLEAFRFPAPRGAPSAPSTPNRACNVPLPRTSPRKQAKALPFPKVKGYFDQDTITTGSSKLFQGPGNLGLSLPTPNAEVSMEPMSPTVEAFKSFYPKRSNQDDQDPFLAASRFYPSPLLSTRLEPSNSPERPPRGTQVSAAQSTPIPFSPPKPSQGHVYRPSATPSESSCGSAGYASAPEEALPSQPSKPVSVASHFKPLVRLLQSYYHERGQEQPFRPSIALEIMSANRQIYDQLPTVKNFTDYAALAAKAGIVKMGGFGGEG
ncbi:hypothetical protein D9611_004319 [Ephemerocybe angulata]|uniref:NYN domain-containing protein n=1 Tax=Ephemerocybe angulata TaxID=980116 RepID=A0A8H5BJK8_9AGAR|nr:hypothetical protein D9611_004319 [Tulosesus angulatus]